MSSTDESTFTAPGCLECGSPVMAARNPFYGVDLAVHKYVRNCVDCSWYDFAGPTSERETAAEFAPKPDRSLQKIWTRVNAAVTMLKSA
jgi:hypothetical protein